MILRYAGVVAYEYIPGHTTSGKLAFTYGVLTATAKMIYSGNVKSNLTTHFFCKSENSSAPLTSWGSKESTNRILQILSRCIVSNTAYLDTLFDIIDICMQYRNRKKQIRTMDSSQDLVEAYIWKKTAYISICKLSYICVTTKRTMHSLLCIKSKTISGFSIIKKLKLFASALFIYSYQQNQWEIVQKTNTHTIERVRNSIGRIFTSV